MASLGGLGQAPRDEACWGRTLCMSKELQVGLRTQRVEAGQWAAWK